MTRKEAEYLNRLEDRRRILETRVSRSNPETVAYEQNKKELNALEWAIVIVNKNLDGEEQ